MNKQSTDYVKVGRTSVSQTHLIRAARSRPNTLRPWKKWHFSATVTKLQRFATGLVFDAGR